MLEPDDLTGADVRLQTLQRLLDESRDRHAELTAELIRSRATNARLESEAARIGVLEVQLAASQSEAESAAARAAVASRRISVLEAQLSASTGLADRLRDRVSELEQDLRTMGWSVAEAATAKAQLDRVQADLDAARERAEDERRHATSDRLQAAAAERQLETVRHRCEALEAKIRELSGGAPGSPDRPSPGQRKFAFPTDQQPLPSEGDESIVDVRDETESGGFFYGSGSGSQQG